MGRMFSRTIVRLVSEENAAGIDFNRAASSRAWAMPSGQALFLGPGSLRG